MEREREFEPFGCWPPLPTPHLSDRDPYLHSGGEEGSEGAGCSANATRGEELIDCSSPRATTKCCFGDNNGQRK